MVNTNFEYLDFLHKKKVFLLSQIMKNSIHTSMFFPSCLKNKKQEKNHNDLLIQMYK